MRAGSVESPYWLSGAQPSEGFFLRDQKVLTFWMYPITNYAGWANVLHFEAVWSQELDACWPSHSSIPNQFTCQVWIYATLVGALSTLPGPLTN